MRILLLLSLLIIGAADARAQQQPRPAQPAPRPAQPGPAAAPAPAPAPAAPRPAQRARRAQPAARSGMAITVTDPRGMTIPGVQVHVMGPTERTLDTNTSGQANLPGLQAGTYRLRFSGAEVITLERDVTLRAGQIADVDVTLSPAPPPPEPPPAPAAPAASAAPDAGPTGEPQTLSVPDLLERNFVGNQPRRDTLLSCSGSTRTTMIQLNGPLPDRVYESADAAYYVIGGEGTARIGGRDSKLATNAYVSVPRGTLHSFDRTGRRPLILLAVVAGERCEEGK